MTETQASLQRYLAEESKAIQATDPLAGSTQANKSFHAVKKKYTNKHLNFSDFNRGSFSSVSNLPIWEPWLAR
jgi:hypothetical protein